MVFLCDRSGIAARPWVEAEYKAVCVDLALPPGVALRDGVWWVGADVRTMTTLRGCCLGLLAFPPCTHLASVGQGAWESKGDAALVEALSIADGCMRWAYRLRARFWAMENPVGRLSHHWGSPDHVFSPHEYGGYLSPSGDDYTKRTCLWTGGAWKMPEKKSVPVRQGSLVESVSDQDRRSETPRGFARAVFESHAPSPDDLLRAGDSLRPGERLRPYTMRPCVWCGALMRAGRTDQKFCSVRCRVASFRAEKVSA